MYFALWYDTVSDYVERRQAFRAEHLALADAALREGKLFLGGALEPSGALLVFRGDTPADAEAFARSDPYVRNGLVTSWRVLPWRVVVGGDPGAATAR